MTFSTPLKSDELEGSRPNPQKRNALINYLAGAPWWLLIIMGIVLAFVITIYNNEFYQSAWNQVRKGIWTTIWVTLVAYALSCLIGLIVAVLRRPSKSIIYMALVYHPISVYVELVRGIPTLVLVFYTVLALVPQLVRVGNGVGDWMVDQGIFVLGVADFLATLRIRDIPEVARAITALAVSYSAFLSEVFRAGLESIDKGQREAARSLGMTGRQVMRLIILPQAIRNVLPPLGNDFIAMLKESSLVSVVGVADITRLGRSFAASTFTLFPAYNLVTITYLVMTLSLSMVVKAMEAYLGRGRQEDK